MLRDLRPLAPLLPVTGLVAVLAWWTFDSGGYQPDTWLPGTLLLMGLTAVALLAGVARPRSGALALALALFAAYTAWSYLSVTWADDPGDALEGSHRTLAFLLCLAMGAILPFTARTGRWLLLAITGTILVAGLVTALRLAFGDDPASLFLDARLQSPLGYQNAGAALWTAGAVPALVLAGRPEVWWPLRPLLLAGGGLLLELAILCQSRGWALALPAIALTALIICPDRVRLSLWALPAAIPALLSIGTLLEPFDVAGGKLATDVAGPLAEAGSRAGEVALLGAAALAVVGLVLVAVDHRVRPGESTRRRVRIGGIAVAALLAAAAMGGALVATDGDPAGRLDEAWADFKDFEGAQQQAEAGAQRFETLGSTRYDFWRVSVDEIRDHPLAGVGQDNFAQSYLVGREVAREEPRWTHSLPLRLLVHTGLVGTLLFFAALLAAGVGVLRARRRGTPEARVVAAAAVLPLAVWLVHGSIDWLWEFPVLSGGALVLLGMAAGLEAPDPMSARWSRGGAVVRGGALVGLAAAAVAVGAAWIAERDVNTAAAAWPLNPPGAIERLDRAARLDPLDGRPKVVAGIIAMNRGQPERARARFAEAAERESADWFALFELGLVASELRDPAAARRHFEAAKARSPLDPLISGALRRVGGRRPMSFREAQQELRLRVYRRLGQPG